MGRFPSRSLRRAGRGALAAGRAKRAKGAQGTALLSADRPSAHPTMAFNAGARPLKLVLKPKPASAAGGGPALGATHDAGGGGGSRAPGVAARLWPTLSDFLASVYSLGAHVSRHSFEELYRAIQDVVAAREGGALYERLTESIRSNAAGRVRSLLTASAGGAGEAAAFLGAVSAAWSAHTTELVVIRNVFLTLDRTYVRETAGAVPI